MKITGLRDLLPLILAAAALLAASARAPHAAPVRPGPSTDWPNDRSFFVWADHLMGRTPHLHT